MTGHPQQKLILIFKKWPLYILLLPVFFVMHGVVENFGFIAPADYLPLIFYYSCVSSAIFLLLFLLYKKRVKAALLTLILLSIFFFYGALQDFLSRHFTFLSRYSVLIPVLFILTVVSIVFLKRTKSELAQLNLYINLLLLIYLLFDLSTLAVKSLFPEKDKFGVKSFLKDYNYIPCKNCDKPDIYFLVFDEYASSDCLKNYFGFDNSKYDSFLVNRQFQIMRKSSGNYNFTPFSVASILNMSYISGLNPAAITSEDYARCNKLIKNAEVLKYFSATGYDIVNYSIFDLEGNPSPVNLDLLPIKTNLITSRTLWGKVKKEILWNLFDGRFKIKWLVRNSTYYFNDYNNKLLTLVKNESSKKTPSPRFIYAHFNMPHPPYYYDRNGKLIGVDTLEYLKINDRAKEYYFDYTLYTNKKIEDLVNTIRSNSGDKAVILVMGDHGYREYVEMPPPAFLENQNAVYLPAGNYKQFYESITGVNQFRVLINTVFNQKIPLLKDSTVFLKDAR